MYAVFLTVFILFLTAVIHRHRYFKKAIPKYKQTFLDAPQSEKERITGLRIKIETVLDVEMPGRDKAGDAWLRWSREDMRGLGEWLNPACGIFISPYGNMLGFLRKAEREMRSVKLTKRDLEIVIEDLEEERENRTVGVRWSSNSDRLAEREKYLKEELEKCNVKAEEAKFVASLVWGIYWPAEVEKAKRRKAEMNGIPPTQV